MFLLKDCRISNCEIKNLLIYLGKLVINNYPAIILEYNHKLSAEVKELMTTVINNLQLCSQLESKISKLQGEVDSILQSDGKNRRVELHKNSLNLKKEKLKQLQVDNYHLLAQIGDRFLKKRLLNSWEEFYNVYSELNDLLDQGGCIKKKPKNEKNIYSRVVNQSACSSEVNFINY